MRVLSFYLSLSGLVALSFPLSGSQETQFLAWCGVELHEIKPQSKANDSLRLSLPKGNPWTESKAELIKAKLNFALFYTKGINAKGV